jgi:hypothetical protein
MKSTDSQNFRRLNYISVPSNMHVSSSMNIKDSITNVLETDKKFRYVGVEDDLFTTDMLKNKNWNYNYPTLQSKHDGAHKKSKSLVETNIVNNLYNKYGFLRNLDMKNILVAGGAVSNAITNHHSYYSDIDMFIYGISDTYEANKVVARIVNHLASDKKYDCNKFFMTPNHITITIGKRNDWYFNRKIQIIFRLYQTKSEILHGFDLGSSAVGFDGKNVWFTTLSKFSYEYSCNIIDSTRRSTTYERRLIKYLRRGFMIVMPEFDINQIHPMDETIVLPKMAAIGYNKNKNQILVDDIFAINNYPGSDYDTETNVYGNDIGGSATHIMSIKWKTETPGTQLTSSFNPIFDEEYMWYGRYYLGNNNTNTYWKSIMSFLNKFAC